MRSLIPPLLLTAFRLILLESLLWLAAFAALGAVSPPSPAPAAFSHSDKEGSTPALLTASGSLPVNTADTDTLQTLPGIGEYLAGQILQYRAEHGPFRYPEDLLRVPGIGVSKLNALLPYITLEYDQESGSDLPDPALKEETP